MILFIARATKRFNDAVWNALLISHLLYIKGTLVIWSVYECMYECTKLLIFKCSRPVCAHHIRIAPVSEFHSSKSNLPNEIHWPTNKRTIPPISTLHIYIYSHCVHTLHSYQTFALGWGEMNCSMDAQLSIDIVNDWGWLKLVTIRHSLNCIG